MHMCVHTMSGWGTTQTSVDSADASKIIPPPKNCNTRTHANVNTVDEVRHELVSTRQLLRKFISPPRKLQHTHTRTRAHMHTYTHASAHTPTYTHAQTHTHTHTNTHIHTHTHVYTHTDTNKNNLKLTGENLWPCPPVSEKNVIYLSTKKKTWERRRRASWRSILDRLGHVTLNSVSGHQFERVCAYVYVCERGKERERIGFG